MKKDELDYPPETFPSETLPSTLDVMNRDRQMYLMLELFEELKKQGRWDRVKRVAGFIEQQFGINLSSD